MLGTVIVKCELRGSGFGGEAGGDGGDEEAGEGYEDHDYQEVGRGDSYGIGMNGELLGVAGELYEAEILLQEAEYKADYEAGNASDK